MEVRWTQHDCWAFMGHCSHFTYVGCDRWKRGCEYCSQKKEYPKSWLLDNSRCNYSIKRRLFTDVENLTIITPSYWLAGLVKQSFLKDYPIEVHHNTIDKSIFKLTPSSFRKQYGLEDKIVLLGVSSVWNRLKGLDDFIALSRILGSEYKIVLVGVNSKQARRLRRSTDIFPITRTENQKQLAEIYSSSDFFLNLTYEDNYPTVNLEADACGCRIITYDTGGSAEAAGEDAIVVERGKIARVMEKICQNISKIEIYGRERDGD